MPVSHIVTPASLLLDDAVAGPIVRKAAAILRALRGRIRQRAMLAFRKPEKRAVRICEIFITDDKDISILKHAGGSESDAWNNYIGAQALASIQPYLGDEEKRDKMRAIVAAGLTGVAPRDEMEGMIAAQIDIG